jgi:RNA polymerase sigma factor (sigma-70 family)
MVAIFRAIRVGGIRDPRRLIAYAWSTAQRILSTRIGSLIAERESSSEEDSEMICDAGPNPETAAIRRQNKEIAAQVLATLPKKQREVLIRYYLRGQHGASIQAEMGLTPTQFRLIKSRAKAALTSRLQQHLADRLSSAPSEGGIIDEVRNDSGDIGEEDWKRNSELREKKF